MIFVIRNSSARLAQLRVRAWTTMTSGWYQPHQSRLFANSRATRPFYRRNKEVLGRPLSQPITHSTGPVPTNRHHSQPATIMPGTITSQPK